MERYSMVWYGDCTYGGKQSKQWQWMLAIAKQYSGQTRKITSSALPLTWKTALPMKNLTWKTAAAPKPHMKKSHENLTWKSHMKNSHENLTWKTHLKNSHEKLHFPKTLLAESRMGLASSICPDSISAVLSRDKKRKFWPFYWAIKSGITFLYLVQPTCKHSKREASSRKYKQIQIQIMPNTNTNTNSVKYKYRNLKTLCNLIVNTARERPHLCSFWGSVNILLVFYLYVYL